MLTTSLEAMQPVLQSKLGKELDAIWQEVIDYRDSVCKDMSYGGKLGALRKFFREKSMKKIQNVVWRNLGLHIKEVFITNLDTGSFANASFFDPQEPNDQTGWFQIDEMLSANYFQKCYPYINFPKGGVIGAEQLVEIAKSFDSNKGVVVASERQRMRTVFNCEIFFDLETGFLMEDRLPRNSGVSYFTPQELTAIILHELGHTINLVEHAADMYARISTFKYLEAAFRSANGSNVEEVVALSEKVASIIEQKGDKVNAERLINIGAKLRHDIRFTGSAQRPDQTKGILGSIIYYSFGFLFNALALPLDIVFGNDQTKRFGVNDQKTKVGDIATCGRMAAWNERHADTFTVQHGYGTFQVSALDKLGKYYMREGRTAKEIEKLNKAEKLHKDLGFLTKARLLIFAPMIAGDASYIIYPEGVKRFREILNQTIQNLKQCSTNPSYVAKYMKDIEFILDRIENFDKKEEYIAKIYRGYDLFLKFVSLPSFIEWIANGRVQRELEQLVNDANAIGNNLLTYYGFKLQQLGTK